MTDIYTGPGPDDEPERSGASNVNGIIYRGMAQVFGRDPSCGVPGPNSIHGQDALGRLHSLDTRGVDRARLALISGLAHIDSDRRTEAEELEAHREIAAIMEEAPGA
jgi:hypothetical protein